MMFTVVKVELRTHVVFFEETKVVKDDLLDNFLDITPRILLGMVVQLPPDTPKDNAELVNEDEEPCKPFHVDYVTVHLRHFANGLLDFH